MAMFTDFRGNPLAIGDRVVATAIDNGAPACGGHGTVVGFARVRIRVQWDGWGYDDRKRYHSTTSNVLSKLNQDGQRLGE